MRALRFGFLLLCTAGTVACRGEDGLNPRDAEESPPASVEAAPPTDDAAEGGPWRARPDGPTLADFVTARAQARAARPWSAPASLATAAVRALDYVAYRGIQFRREAAIWAGQAPFEVQLFHPGGGFDVPVRIHVVDGGEARPLAFDPDRFRHGDEVAGRDLALPLEAGHAGFRLLYPLNDAGRMDEVVSFLGASYFRLLGPGHVYGLSTRGVAVNTAGAGGEEFPDFVEFWLERPEPGADRARVHALLDGPSVTGAFTFNVIPGDAARDRPTVVDVDARLFARADIATLGLAPLTSMYLHGTFDAGGHDDVRPRVHDSEGLLVRTSGGEWIWRPLTNRTVVQTTSLSDTAPAGFGLVQRDRDFASYLDLEARYDRRPSQWVEAGPGDWGAGAVRLVELPTPSEFNDNVVAFWAPHGGMEAGTSRHLRYRLISFDDRLHGGELPGGPLLGESLARVERTRIGWDGLPGQTDPPPPTRRRVVLDFVGGPLDTLPAGAEPEAEVTTSAGIVEDVRVLPLPSGGRRVTFAISPEGDRPADMRVYLKLKTSVLSETWSYLLAFDRPR
ncbi:MAG: glucan biosynthesis protein [Longimicrobiales bacterium]